MIHDDDRSFLYGDGLFETVRVESAGPIALDRHIARIRRSARELGYPGPAMNAGTEALEALRDADEGLWRVTVSRPGDEIAFGGTGCVSTRHRPLPAIIRPRLVMLMGFYHPGDRLAEHKTTSYLRSVEARRRAVRLGYDDALMLSGRGLIGEASSANVFLVCGDRLLTPEIDGVLPGITRARVIEVCREAGVDVVVRSIEMVEASSADEVLLTSAGLGVVAAHMLHRIEGNGVRREFGTDFAATLTDWLEGYE